MNKLERDLDEIQEMPCMEGDVTDGSVDYYDFNWGEEVLIDEGKICCGCQGAKQAYEGCAECCSTCPDPDTDPCVPVMPAQEDDPEYEMVKP